MEEYIIEDNIGYIAKTFDGYYLIFDRYREVIDNGYATKKEAKETLNKYFGLI